MEYRKLTDIEKEFVPHNCPRCGSELFMAGKDLKCTNRDCAGATRSDLQHWTALISEVDGLGGKIKDDFFDTNNIETVEDLYNTINNIRFGESVTDKKLLEMKDKLINQKVDAIRALVALNIPRLGWKSAEKIINNGRFLVLANLPNIVGAEYSTSINIIEETVGQATRKSIELNINKLKRLEFLRGRIVASRKSEESFESKGEVVITGKLSMKRSEFEEIIKNAGYTPVGKVNKNTVYLITDNPNGTSSKNKTANELGIPKISESEFMEIINNE